MTEDLPSGRYRYIPQKDVIFGRPAAGAIADHCADQKRTRVLLVATRSVARRTAHVEGITNALGARCIGTFDEVFAHAPMPSVLELANRIRKTAPDLIVVVGGGSAVDTTKVALIAAATNAGTIPELVAYARRHRQAAGAQGELPSPPCRTLAVPTTLSGAEFGVLGGAIDPSTRIKELFWADYLCAESVVYDAAITVDTPDWLWLSTGMRAVDHAVETILSLDANPYTDALALEGLRLLASGLRAARRNGSDLAARQRCQFGVWLACVGIGRTRYGASHGIGHQLGAVVDVPHGYTSCVLLPAVLRYNEAVAGDRYARIATALGSDDGDAAAAVFDLVGQLGLPQRLAELKVDASAFKQIAETALQNAFVQANPRPIRLAQDVEGILQSVL